MREGPQLHAPSLTVTNRPKKDVYLRPFKSRVNACTECAPAGPARLCRSCATEMPDDRAAPGKVLRRSGPGSSSPTIISSAADLTANAISDTAAIAPVPTSPQARRRKAGGTTRTPQPRSTLSAASVAGCAHISEFMAGATIMGARPRSQARAMHGVVMVLRRQKLARESLQTLVQ